MIPAPWLGAEERGGWLCDATVLTPEGRLSECDLAVAAGRIAELAPRSPGRAAVLTDGEPAVADGAAIARRRHDLVAQVSAG